MIRPHGPPPRPDVVAAHYGSLDRYYRALWGEDVHHGLWERGDESPDAAVEALTRKVAGLTGVAPGDRVCDVGCGYGGTARFLADRHGAEVTGVTVSPDQLRVARRREEGVRGRPPVRYLLGDWLETSLPRDHFDAVVAVESLTHMPDLQEALDRVATVLRPGGRFVACVWLASPDARPWMERRLLEPICREGRLTGLPTADELRAALHRAGLEEIEPWEDLSRGVRRTWTETLRRGVRHVLADPEARRFILDPGQPDRVFAVTMLRIWAAFRVGAMQYGLFTTTPAEHT